MIESKRVNLKWADLKMSNLDLTKLITHFSQSNKADGKSPKTESWYTEMLTYYVKYLKSTDVNTTLSEFNVHIVREYIIHEQSRGLSPFTVQCKVRALKAFSSWLTREGYTPENMLINIKLPKAPSKLIVPLTTDEVDKLLKAQNPLTAIGARNIAILITLLDAGPRCNELSSLRYEDAHIEEGYLKVMGKGNKERQIPIGSMAQKVLWRYVFHFRPEPLGEPNNYLFLTLDGKRLEVNAIKLILKRWGIKAGVPRLHAHLCRHTYATNFLIHRCGDVFLLQRILGHSTLEMVNKYVHYASLQTMIQNHPTSPIDVMGIKQLRQYKIDRALKNCRV